MNRQPYRFCTTVVKETCGVLLLFIAQPRLMDDLVHSPARKQWRFQAVITLISGAKKWTRCSRRATFRGFMGEQSLFRKKIRTWACFHSFMFKCVVLKHHILNELSLMPENKTETRCTARQYIFDFNPNSVGVIVESFFSLHSVLHVTTVGKQH